jgi:replicative DNA helicase
VADGSALFEADGLPHNLDAEMALLGILLLDNAAYERVPQVKASTFFEPFHGRLFDAIEKQIRKGGLAEPALLASQLKNDPALVDLEADGVQYLAGLVANAPPASYAQEYAKVLHELALRRGLISVSADIAATAKNTDIGPGDQIEAAEQKLYALAEAGTPESGPRPFAHYLTSALQMAAEAFSREGGMAGIATDLIDLDQKIGGLQSPDLIILAGRPSMGKTALATNIAFNIAKRYAYEVQPDGTHKTVAGGRVMFFSLEMSGEQLTLRILASAAGVSSDRMRKGDIEATEFGRVRDAAIELQEAPLYIDHTGGISIAKMFARARRQKRQTGLDLIVVDYLQLVTTGQQASVANRVQEVSMVTMALKAMAKELGVPVIALSQLSRQVEQRDDKRPQLSDLRESGSIEQDADMVWFVFREAYYLGRAEPREGTPEHQAWLEEMDKVQGLAELIIAKQRHGPIGTVRLSFNDDLTQFGNLARQQYFAQARDNATTTRSYQTGDA